MRCEQCGMYFVMKKCVLLCKSCHYEIHHGFDLDGDLL
jgi:hypothetical protein